MIVETRCGPVAVGECLLIRIDGGWLPRLRIGQADPRVLITSELLGEVCGGDSPWAALTGDVLRIEAENQTVIYRIGEYLSAHDAYLAEWPD